MTTAIAISQMFEVAYSKATKSAVPASFRVCPGIYAVRDAKGVIWELSQQDEIQGRPWVASEWGRGCYGAYSDYYGTKRDALAALGV